MDGYRMNCSLFRAISERYVVEMFNYCRAWGWRYMRIDTLRDILYLYCCIFGHKVIHRKEYTHAPYCGRCNRELFIN